MNKTLVLAIVGPTATGKSALGMAIAQSLGGEIVCMDSMQVYRGMDIGTAKPSKAEQQAVPHHMLDLAEPTESFSVSRYAERAENILHAIWARGHLPVLVGGTGLYLKALTQGLHLGRVGGDEAIRAKLHAIAEEENGKARLHAMLSEVDPATGAKLHKNDLRRVIRALEVYEVTGTPLSRQSEPAAQRPFAFCMLGAVMERELLYDRVNRRVDDMMATGLVDEVKALLGRGVPSSAQSMQGIGYKELIPMLEGRVTRSDAVHAMKQNTRHFAKRQWTWFRGEKQIQWLDMADASAEGQALTMAARFLEEQTSGER